MSKVTPYGLTKVLGGLKETAICDDAQNVFRGGKTGAELLSILINGYSKRRHLGIRQVRREDRAGVRARGRHRQG